MRMKRLRSPEDALFEQAMELYRISFPHHEQREGESQREILSREAYHFGLLYEEEAFVGLMLYWETADFLYVEHFCMLPEVRGRGLGGKALELLAGQGKTIILEIDPPVDEVSRRRKGFYERAGFVENPWAHVHPPYHKNHRGHDLVVMSRPEQLAQSRYAAFALYLENTVMAGAIRA